MTINKQNRSKRVAVGSGLTGSPKAMVTFDHALFDSINYKASQENTSFAEAVRRLVRAGLKREENMQ